MLFKTSSILAVAFGTVVLAKGPAPPPPKPGPDFSNEHNDKHLNWPSHFPTSWPSSVWGTKPTGFPKAWPSNKPWPKTWEHAWGAKPTAFPKDFPHGFGEFKKYLKREAMPYTQGGNGKGTHGEGGKQEHGMGKSGNKGHKNWPRMPEPVAGAEAGAKQYPGWFKDYDDDKGTKIEHSGSNGGKHLRRDAKAEPQPNKEGTHGSFGEKPPVHNAGTGHAAGKDGHGLFNGKHPARDANPDPMKWHHTYGYGSHKGNHPVRDAHPQPYRPKPASNAGNGQAGEFGRPAGHPKATKKTSKGREFANKPTGKPAMRVPRRWRA